MLYIMKNRQFIILLAVIIAWFIILYNKDNYCDLLPSIYDKVDLIDLNTTNTKDLINWLVDNQDYLEFIINKKKEL